MVLCYALGLCVFLLLAGLALFLLITHRPETYNPPAPIEDRQVSPYLTHELATSFHNNLQSGKSFDLVIEQAGLNDIIARGKWPQKLNGLIFSAPVVLFIPENVLLMGTVTIQDIEVVVTIGLQSEFDESGRLRLQVTTVRVGALDITIFAKQLAAEIFRQQASKIQGDELLGTILSSLIGDESFDPILEIEGRRLRIENITVTSERLTIRFAPTA